MHVGLNLVYLVPGEVGGMEIYARELIPALLAERPELRLTAFINREAREAHEGPWHELVPSVTVDVRARRRSEWVRGEQQLLPRLAKRAGVDLVHSLAGTSPAWGAFRRVVTVNDLIYRIYPEAHFGLRSRGVALLILLAARRSHRVIAPSSNTRDDLVKLLHVPPQKIDVVPDGVGTTGAAIPLAGDQLRTRARSPGRSRSSPRPKPRPRACGWMAASRRNAARGAQPPAARPRPTSGRWPRCRAFRLARSVRVAAQDDLQRVPE